MNRVFVDTSGWMMLADEGDPLHAAATGFREQWMATGGEFVTTDYVADETLTLVRVRLGIDAAERWWQTVEGSPRVRWEIIRSDRAARARAWFFRWRDHAYSLTDCTSFVVMQELRLRRALTGDHHFATAGFETCPTPTRKARRRS